ncbi:MULTISPECIES: hypothetical protein [Thioclava]|uniref:Arginine transporter n=1 Tax=Thioclava nitratireducens TaxID=1915078 RepID=A0ABM6IKA5_9RHOB|nr:MULTISPECIES: hypothetical protein [Thioclava]AQS49368.1 hypothetical protein BMG03_17410 [Thioclava nitratireducens]OWY03292.1 hypothetical protein B6V76_10630 [Thioclava sp. IC9]OWY03621.1 hypothetical protein B6V75_09330 [Thioclava sp. F1Mire-8]OWY09584.1 hypothetical protein B6V74_06055 [Thioclava sp. F42-5]OWY14430.1 hypothetical protein B6V72_04010 [Thioclava sp. F34-6]
MTFKTTLGLCAFSGAVALASMASAGPIDNACLKAGRASNPGTCGCIQQVADMTLSHRDQRRAASFFHDPDRAQEVRMSDRKSDSDFWDRYKNFASTAEGFCK